MLLLLVLLLSHLFLFLLSPDPVYIPRTDGSWVGFGENNNGELGLGDTTNRNTPTTLTALFVCDFGSYGPVADSCTACEAGRYGAGSSTCAGECPADKAFSMPGSAAEAQCTPYACTAGTYETAGSCTSCARGRFGRGVSVQCSGECPKDLRYSLVVVS
jgi:hypothetical protein